MPTNSKQLAAIQEMFERKRDLRAQVTAAKGLRKSEDQAIGHIKSVWVDQGGQDHQFEWESVRRFLAYGLSVDELRQAIHTVRGRGLIDRYAGWKYFCGIGWRLLKDRQPATQTA